MRSAEGRTKMKTKSILITGVGGQGTLLAARIIGGAAITSGYEVKVSEVHGMSQRGGSVITYVRYGENVHSPIICRGEADVILSFETLEAGRYLEYLAPDGVVVTSTQKINPMPVVSGAMQYPEAIIEKIAATGAKIISADALSAAESLGNTKASNVVMIGLAAAELGLDEDKLFDSMCACVPKKALDLNVAAFRLGQKMAKTK